jgi:signal transduction histidine kinase/DNA-binding response OmpR family regulator
VSVFNGESFTHYTENDGLSNNFVISILEDQSGNIWLGTQGGGVSLFNGESFTHYGVNEGVSNNTVWSIAEDKNGNIWLGTEGGGVSVFNGESFTHYTEREGLANNSVWSILEDQSAPLNEIGVFIGTEKGLSKISLKENEPSGDTEFAFSIQNFGKQDGLKSLRFNPGAIIDSKNRAWWGTGNGLVSLDLNTLKFSDKIPQPRLSQLEINEQFTDYRTIPDSPDSYQDQIKFNGVQKFDNYPLSLQSPYDKNHLTFYFAAIDWAAPHKIRYSYRMKGLNINWSEPTPDPVADYRNLTFGAYTFQIRAVGESGVWSEPFDYAFTILPPWWHSWWAYFLYAVLFLNGLYLLRRYELNRFNLKNQLQLERVETDSLRKLDQEKNRFFTNISHEFRTPLTLTLGPLQDLRNGAHGKLTTGALDQIDLAIRNSRRLLRLVGQLMDLTRLENKKFELNMKPGNLSNYLETLSEPFIPTAKRHGISFIVDLPHQPIYARFDDEHFDKIIANLLSNAFKFTPKNGTVTLQLSEVDGVAEIRIRDTGSGISENHQQQLFERFYQVQKSEIQPGTGIGLSIAKELTLLHGGDIYVSSEVGKGSNFIVRISTTGTIKKAGIAPISETAELQSDIELNPEQNTQQLPQISDKDSDSENDIRKTILVVDDHADIRSYLGNHLSEIYNVSEAATGTEALSIINNELPDLVISDVMMPDGDGFELLKQIRQNPEINFIPVILLTAKVEAEDKLSGLGIGANDYITKPFNIQEILIRVENLFKNQKRLQRHLELHPFINGYGKIHHDKVNIKSADEIYLDAVKHQIQNHLSNENFSVEVLAGELNQSRSNLHRRLTKLTGESPSSMIRRIRIELGAQLLLQNAGTVSEVAYSTGFKSVAHFSRVFRDHFDQTPTEFMISRQ